MGTEDNTQEDAVVVALNPAPALVRPADGATKAKWVDYVVALGADRGHTVAQEYTVSQLRDLADRLGG